MRRLFVAAAVATLAFVLSACGPAADPEGEKYFVSAERQAKLLTDYNALVGAVFDGFVSGGLGPTITYTRAGGVGYPPKCPPSAATQVGANHNGSIQICTVDGKHSLITEMKNGVYLKPDIIGVRLGDLEVYKSKNDEVVHGEYIVNGKKTGPSVSQKPAQIKESDAQLLQALRDRMKTYIK